MYLKDMVGKLAIRTAEAFNPEPFPPVHLDFSFPVFSPKPGSTRKYMDEPVKIINVKEDQVVIEDTEKESFWREGTLTITGLIMTSFCIQRRKSRKS